MHGKILRMRRCGWCKPGPFRSRDWMSHPHTCAASASCIERTAAAGHSLKLGLHISQQGDGGNICACAACRHLQLVLAKVPPGHVQVIALCPHGSRSEAGSLSLCMPLAVPEQEADFLTSCRTALVSCVHVSLCSTCA